MIQRWLLHNNTTGKAPMKPAMDSPVTLQRGALSGQYAETIATDGIAALVGHCGNTPGRQPLHAAKLADDHPSDACPSLRSWPGARRPQHGNTGVSETVQLRPHVLHPPRSSAAVMAP